MSDVIEIKTRDYRFDYIDIQYDNAGVSLDAEIYRWERTNELRTHMYNVLFRHGFVPIKHSLALNISNIISRILLESFSAEKIHRLRDGFFNAVPNSKALMDNLVNTLKTPQDIDYEEVVREIDVDSHINRSIDGIALSEYQKNREYEYTKDSRWITLRVDCINCETKIPAAIYKKLRSRYKEYKMAHPEHLYDFDDLVRCLMLRYHTFGIQGNQMGIPPEVKDFFRTQYRTNFEGMASSLNHHYKYYCSIFYDIEKYFCSLGPFQNITYIRGAYTHNPPYEKNLLYQLVKVVLHAMEESDQKLLFIIGTPVWKQYNITFNDTLDHSKFYKDACHMPNYRYLWWNFLTGQYATIPESNRYLLANYEVDKKGFEMSMRYWADINPRGMLKKSAGSRRTKSRSRKK